MQPNLKTFLEISVLVAAALLPYLSEFRQSTFGDCLRRCSAGIRRVCSDLSVWVGGGQEERFGGWCEFDSQ